MPPSIRTTIALIPALLAGFTVLATPAAPAPPRPGSGPQARPGWAARLDPFLRRVALGSSVEQGGSRRALGRGREALATLPAPLRVDRGGRAPAVFVKARLVDGGDAGASLRAALRDLGVTLRARVGPIASLRVPVTVLDRVAALPGIAWMKAARAYRLQNNVSTASSEVDSDDVNAVFGGHGAGAIVAIIDTGIDYRSLDFRTAAGQTRVLGIWDQTVTDAAHPPPPGFDFGAYYSQADIDAALSGGVPPPLDGYGHGTHVAGTAAGSGLQTGNGVPAKTFEGVAPEADLLIVRVFDSQGIFCDACDLTAAVEFVQQVAAARGEPWVGNMSLGSDLGAHDGTDPDELTIDAAVGPGRRGAQMAIAAGNSGGLPIHWEGVTVPGAVVADSFSVPSYAAQSGSDNDLVLLDLWYGGAGRATVEVFTPTGLAVSAAPGVDSGVVCTDDGAVQIDATGTPDPANGDNEVFVQIWDSALCTPTRAPRTGSWAVRIIGDAQSPAVPFDLWNEAQIAGLSHVSLSSSVNGELVSVPGTARHAITVGAYVDKTTWLTPSNTMSNVGGSNILGGLSSFSGTGPTRDGRIKPDVAAPGEWIGSTLTGLIQASRGTTFTEQDGVHGDIRGTSMATPHVAGTVALLQALNPALDGAELKEAIRRSARGDTLTGTLPNQRFGAGKLRAFEAASAAVTIVTDLDPTGSGGFTAPASLFVDSYRVYRGTLSGLPASGYGSCLLSGLPTPDFADAATPPGGAAYFYLVAGVRGLIEGSLGTDSDGNPRLPAAACP
jgi:subtilisin family serine protease